MVKKSICREDKRLVDVLLTDKGKKLLQSMDGMNEEMDSVFKYLSNDEAKLLNVLLDKIRMIENPSEDNSAETAITG